MGTPQHIVWQVATRSALANRTRGVSANALLPRSVVLEVHNHDSHLKPMLDRIEQARHIYPGCTAAVRLHSRRGGRPSRTTRVSSTTTRRVAS